MLVWYHSTDSDFLFIPHGFQDLVQIPRLTANTLCVLTMFISPILAFSLHWHLVSQPHRMAGAPQMPVQCLLHGFPSTVLSTLPLSHHHASPSFSKAKLK